MDITEIDNYNEEKPKEEVVKKVTEEVSVITTDPLVATASAAGIQLDATQMKALEEFTHKVKFGYHSAIAMLCQGTQCPFLAHCPLFQVKATLPVGKACPVERSMIMGWVHDTLVSLDIDPKDPQNQVDLHMAFELASMELIQYRAACHMADDPALTEMRIVGYSPQGQPIYDEKPKLALLILERQSKSMGKLREQLLATRKSQAQVGRVPNDVSTRGATMFKRAREIAEQRMAKRNEIVIEAEVKQDEPKQ